MSEGGIAPSPGAIEVLRLLKEHHLVLLSGPPSTGKTHLLREVEVAFKLTVGAGYDPEGPVPFPDEDDPTIEEWLPSPEKSKRRAFSTTFHPHAKHRDFIQGVAPRLDGEPGFMLVRGVLLEANDYAKDGAALLVIEEINRGPAVQLFGDTIVAIEGDKRRSPAGNAEGAASFRLVREDGSSYEETLSAHLYIVAAMNRTDTSVEPMDVAFLRRWHEHKLEPDERVLVLHFDVSLTDLHSLPDEPTKPEHLYLAAIAAWQATNERVALGRGEDFRIGHGLLMQGDPPDDMEGAADYLRARWTRMRTLIDEVFFGDARGIAAVLNTDDPANPYEVEERFFAGEPVVRIVGTTPTDPRDFYRLLRSVAATGE